jgi:hypothetical protein
MLSAVTVTAETLPASRSMERWLAIGGWMASMACVVVALVIWTATGFADPQFIFMAGGLPLVALLISSVAQATSALILTLRRPDNAVGWTIVGFSLLVAAACVVIALSARPQAANDSLAVWLAWGVSWFVFPACLLLAFRLAFIFPSGRPLSRMWAVAFRALVALTIVVGLAIAFRPGNMLLFPTFASPLAMLAPIATRPLAGISLLALALASGLSALALVARYRVSDAVGRLQMRWYIASAVLLALLAVAFVTAVVLLRPTDRLGVLTEAAFYATIGLPPIAITTAILRYRLYEIDLILSRAFVYGVLTALLAGMYTAGIRLFNSLFTTVTGESSDLALVLTTLLLATTFTPIKSRLERFAQHRLVPAPAAEPAPSPADLLADPQFSAALDARIADIVKRERRRR